MCSVSDVHQESVLLYGPRGCGKSLFVKALFGEVGELLVILKPAKLLDEPSVLEPTLSRLTDFGMLGILIEHIDEVFAGLRQHPGVRRYLLDELRRPHCVRVIFATSRRPESLLPEELDAFTHVFPALYPDKQARAEILAVHATRLDLKLPMSLDEVSALTEWWSGEELKELLEDTKPGPTASAVSLQRSMESIGRHVVVDRRKKRTGELLRFTAEHCTDTAMRRAVSEQYSAIINSDSGLVERPPRLVNKTIFRIKEMHMGDKYSTGDIYGSVVGGHGHSVNFSQVWNQMEGGGFNLRELAEQLPKLRAELLKQASDPEQYAAIGAIAEAEIEAAKGNGPKVLEFLAKSGKWVFDVATKIGEGVATAALKEALGIK